MRRIISIAALSVVSVFASVSLAACGLGDKSTGDSQKVVASDAAVSGEITFQTWSLKNDKFTPYFTKLISDFQAKYPGTKINWVDQPGDGYAAKITSQVTSDSLPDVVNLPPEIAHAVAKTGNLLDLTKNVPTLATDYVKSALTAYTYADTKSGSDSFGFPWYLGTDVNYWNKTIMSRNGLDASKPPTTFDEMLAQAKIMYEKSGGKDFIMSRAPGLSDIVNSGTQLMNSDGTKFVFNTAAAATMLDKYTDAFKKGYLPSNLFTSGYLGNSTLFNKQEVAWTTGTGYFIEGLKQTNPTLAANILPSAAIDTPPLYVQGLSVASKSKNLPLALAFAKFATNDTNQVAFVQLAKGFLPGSAASATRSEFTKSDGTPQGDASVIAYQSLQKAVNFTPPAWTSQMDTILGQEISKAMTGKQTSQQALDNAVSQVNALLTQ